MRKLFILLFTAFSVSCYCQTTTLKTDLILDKLGTPTGSLGAIWARVTKGWFTDIDVTNLPFINGVSIHNNPTFTGTTTMEMSITDFTVTNQLQIGTSDSAIIIEGLSDVGTGLTVVKDGAPITYNFPPENLIQIETIAVMQADAIIGVNDTTVTKEYGRIVFREADSSFYGCRFIRPTGKKCWFILH